MSFISLKVLVSPAHFVHDLKICRKVLPNHSPTHPPPLQPSPPVAQRLVRFTIQWTAAENFITAECKIQCRTADSPGMWQYAVRHGIAHSSM